MSNIRGMRPLSRTIKRSALSIALGMCVAGGVQAQSTSGNIYGKADSGQTITIVSDTGLTRSVTADANGSFSVASLPAGSYKVTSGGQTRDVLVKVNSGVQVDFTAAKDLDKVSVVGNRAGVTPIDVSQTDMRTVFTADELQKISVGRSINDVALLAPGVISSTSYSGLGSFGGAAASENAYYINGFPVTNPLTSIGYTTLGFDSIAQEQILTGGYGAEYGRSTGGVINIVTKRGTNQWKGGVYTIWTPKSLKSDPENLSYANTGFWNQATHYNTTAGNNPLNWTDGTLYMYRKESKSENFTYGAYVGGPIIKDRLFVYANGERSETEGNSVRYTRLANNTASNAAQSWNDYSYTYPRWTAKLDWNITDNHTLELTGVQDNTKYEYNYYGFNYNNLSHNDVKYNSGVTEDKARLYVGKYTGYLTDDLSISALYGQQTVDHVPAALTGYDPSKTYIGIASNLVPSAFAGISNPQKYQTITDPSEDKTKGYRFDINYQLGQHELRAGYDFFKADSYIGDDTTGPGYYWSYAQQSTPTLAIDSGHGVGAPASAGGYGAQGYYVTKNYSKHGGTVSTEQKAWYLEDRWHVTDTLLLSLGLRNDGFTNYNGEHKVYADQKNNWAPRIGFAWDVHDDASLKIFGNAGRYHLALPNNVAIRGANASLSTSQYYTYTGIAADGTPTGLAPIPTGVAPSGDDYRCANGGISANLECGNAPDPRTVAAVGLKAHYQDEYILGMEQMLSDTFSWGAKVTYRELKSAIDDICPTGCYLFNPGETNTFYEYQDDGSLAKHTYTNEDLGGFPKLKRKYGALDLFTEYHEDGLYAKIQYTLSHNWGNAEGQLNSSIDTGSGGQADVSVTQDWDLPELMVGANGPLPNNRTHQIKVISYLEISDEWRVGGSVIIQSGRPRTCTTYWPDPSAAVYNGAFYYYGCGIPGNGTTIPASAGYGFSPRGSGGETPWSSTFNANVAYTPGWAQNKLTLQMDVLNIFNTQTATAYYDRYAQSRTTVNPRFGQVLYYTDPRSVRFTARYDF